MYWSKSSGQSLQAFCQANSNPQSSHSMSIRIVKAVSSTEFFTAGWDGKCLQWDTSKGKFAINGVIMLSNNVPNKIYAMDANSECVVIGTADKRITVYNRLQQGFGPNCAPIAQYELPKYQIRCISLFAGPSPACGQSGFCVGTIEGRVHIEYMNEIALRNNRTQQENFEYKVPGFKSFNFKCHRESIEKHNTKTTKIFTINSIHFNQRYNTFLTAGSDGILEIWDADNKTKVAPLVGTTVQGPTTFGSKKAPVALSDQYEYKCPITAAKFSPNSKLLFAAFSYDWSRGESEFAAFKDSYPNYVSIFQTVTPNNDDSLIRPKPSSKSGVGGRR
jgi:mRNA export factor